MIEEETEIIGEGIAGLATALALKWYGIHSFNKSLVCTESTWSGSESLFINLSTIKKIIINWYHISELEFSLILFLLFLFLF
jgi:heterodisulfide reductase subunit A-like polyferredoxin